MPARIGVFVFEQHAVRTYMKKNKIDGKTFLYVSREITVLFRIIYAIMAKTRGVYYGIRRLILRWRNKRYPTASFTAYYFVRRE